MLMEHVYAAECTMLLPLVHGARSCCLAVLDQRVEEVNIIIYSYRVFPKFPGAMSNTWRFSALVQLKLLQVN